MYSFKECSFEKQQNADKIIANCPLDVDINLRDEYVVTSISSSSILKEKTIEFTKIKRANKGKNNER